MPTYIVTYERLGRGTPPPPSYVGTVSDNPAQEIAEEVYRLGRKRLASKEFSVAVTIDPDTGIGEGSVDGGRFGRFTIKEDRS